MNYYYFAASLPTPAFDRPPALSVEQFLRLCGEYLAAGDLATMHALLGRSDGGEGNDDFSRRWKRLDTALRNAVARERAARLGRKADPYIRQPDGAEVYVARAVSEAMARKNPLETEKALDRLRWNLIEELQGTHPFSPQALFGYGLKLAIAERWAGMDANKGAERLNAMAAVPV